MVHQVIKETSDRPKFWFFRKVGDQRCQTSDQRSALPGGGCGDQRCQTSVPQIDDRLASAIMALTPILLNAFVVLGRWAGISDLTPTAHRGRSPSRAQNSSILDVLQHILVCDCLPTTRVSYKKLIQGTYCLFLHLDNLTAQLENIFCSSSKLAEPSCRSEVLVVSRWKLSRTNPWRNYSNVSSSGLYEITE